MRADQPTLFIACSLPVRAGGELVNFQHVASLCRQGWRAVALLDGASAAAWPTQAPAVPMVMWDEHLQLQPGHWLVLPEVTPPASWARLAPLAARGVRLAVHNQNPYYTFRGFASVAAMNGYPLAGGICCSHFTADTLRRWGSTTDWQVVRPALLPHFAQAGAQADARPGARQRQIACMPRKRPDELATLQALLRGLYPQWAEVPWRVIDGLSRQDVARALAASTVFLSLSRLEGLGLPPLEAMAAGCVVAGFSGGGGQEYATPDNGLWAPEGDLEACAQALAAALDLAPDAHQARVAAGRATAAQFSAERFDAELDAAWRALLGRAGDEVGRYRVA